MLERLRLAGFKSVGDPVELRLAPLTVVTGANSSGKSTLLQALLVLAQTSSSVSPERVLILNGRYVRMGNVDDVLHHPRSSKGFSLGIDVRPDRPSERRTAPLGRTLTVQPDTQPQHVRFNATFIPPPAKIQKNRSDALIYSTEFHAYFEDGHESHDGAFVKVKRSGLSPDVRIARDGYEEGSLSEWDRRSLEYRVQLDRQSRDDVAISLDTSNFAIKGADLNHFFVNELSARVNLSEVMSRRIIARVTGKSRKTLVDRLRMPTTFWRTLFELSEIDSSRGLGDAEEVSIGDVRRLVLRLPPPTRRRLAKEWDELAQPSVQSPSWQLESCELPERLRAASHLVEQHLTRIRYIGPLRIQPAPVYPVSHGVRSDDVGIAGEWTAAVLDDYADYRVPFFDNFKPLAEGRPKQAPLSVAVSLALKQLGLVDRVEVRDRGNLGHEVLVTPAGLGRSIPIAQVGVGVSQCLPVIVQCLIADPGDTLILEQPELHLHPAVQSRLADFLLSIAATGKQLIVETHSEHFVSRLRRRIAEGAGTPETLSVYFVEYDSGESLYREIEISDTGLIDYWPSGFFDQGQTEAEAILLAGIERRRSQK